MREVVLFIAMSLDGYIADKNGNIDWLVGQNQNEEMPDVYSEFIKDVDTVVMGWNTYHQVVTELSPEEWPYEEQTSYVITHREKDSEESIIFTNETPCELVKKLKREDGKIIWICGGANVIQPLIKEDLIDKYYISVIPTILGDGVRLFETGLEEIKLKLVRTQAYNGITELVYGRR